MNPGLIQELIDTKPKEEKLVEDTMLEMSISKTRARLLGRRHRRSRARKQTDRDNLAEGFWLFKTAFDCFYRMDPSLNTETKSNSREIIGTMQTHF